MEMKRQMINAPKLQKCRERCSTVCSAENYKDRKNRIAMSNCTVISNELF